MSDAPTPKTHGPLAGVRILDLTRVLAGPFCTRHLSDLGADVVKLEPPVADMTRGMGRRINGISGYFLQQNAGKRNMCVDFSKPGAAELVLRIAEKSDVVVENFRPGVMARLGLDDDTLLKSNPNLIICHISGFGQDSTEEDKRAFAGVVHAMSGLLHMQALNDEREPSDIIMALGDTYTGSMALSSILAALYHKVQTGEGQVIDIAMHDVMLAVNECTGLALFESPDALTGFRGRVLKGKDGHLLYAGDAVHNWEKVCECMKRPELLEDPRFLTVEDRQKNRPQIDAILNDWVGEQSSVADAERQLEEFGLPSGILRTLHDALKSPQAVHRGMICEVSDKKDGTVKVINTPYHYSKSVTGPQSAAAYRGENNEELLREILGASDDEIGELEASGVIFKTQKKKR